MARDVPWLRRMPSEGEVKACSADDGFWLVWRDGRRSPASVLGKPIGWSHMIDQTSVRPYDRNGDPLWIETWVRVT